MVDVPGIEEFIDARYPVLIDDFLNVSPDDGFVLLGHRRSSSYVNSS